jgi:cytochrome P450/NADPH-cytochrome P450 reductase
LLIPVFGPMGIRKVRMMIALHSIVLTIAQMFPGMMDIVTQMLLKWDRLGPDNEILCSDDFTRYFPRSCYTSNCSLIPSD